MVLGAMPQKDVNLRMVEWFAHEGIAKDRLSFYPVCGIDEYLALHHQVDICLDTFPYNGGTTSWHALTMGVPTLTLAGDTPASRTGAFMLGHMELSEFLAHDKEDFVRKGLAWRDNFDQLSQIRAELRERYLKSAIGQPALVAAGFERALQTMWQRWCMGLPPKSFAVDGQTQLPS
jgi:predicted O-linked N-acetylglucosamine transferase (SPINDLY family)